MSLKIILNELIVLQDVRYINLYFCIVLLLIFYGVCILVVCSKCCGYVCSFSYDQGLVYQESLCFLLIYEIDFVLR